MKNGDLASANLDLLLNQPESKSFLKTALAWQGSVTPKVVTRVLVTGCYAAVVYFAESHLPHIVGISMTPFEYLGVFLALILVLRVNAGHERWWEGRKLWGNIANHSRNLALVFYGYGDKGSSEVQAALKWIAAWPFVVRESLIGERQLKEVSELLGAEETKKILAAENMPLYVAYRLTVMLASLRQNGLDPYTFLRADTEKSGMVEDIGACERIRSTRMPLVLAIKTRRFITMFLLLLPFGLIDRLGIITPLVVALASYTLFSLDEIGAELQNPFSPRNISHLPLKAICKMISSDVTGLLRL